MSALPDHTGKPTDPAATSAAERFDQPRHLYPVHPTEDTIEVPAVPGQDSDSDATGGTLTERVAWLRTVFTPEAGLYTDRPPSIAEAIRRAKHGRQLAADGPLRKISIAHGYVAAANKAAVRTWEWIVDHQARFAVFLLLLGLALVFPPTRQLIAWLLYPVAWVQQQLD
ncbi:hypothetical protein [Amycolatopsis sp. ATCC 39116]|uniref:hypothetical protein n=1 Tax=Amycolatopsis sp. (strain ATCC 39116 / 75iv2) TaxID=385957 RepID=UPI0002625916|nr:hypothetical protein [Amycolatopsis sp. ATCC 39116]